MADAASAPPPTRPLTMPEWEARWAEQQMPVRTPVRIRNPREALEKQHLMGRLHRIEREGAHDDGDDVAGPSTKPKAVGTMDMDEFTSIFARAMAESDSSPEPASPSSPDEAEPHNPGSMLADLALVDAENLPEDNRGHSRRFVWSCIRRKRRLSRTRRRANPCVSVALFKQCSLVTESSFILPRPRDSYFHFVHLYIFLL